MKRLYYVTQDLDDAELISDEVHSQGIDDHHFLAVSRDADGLNAHHLHGEVKLEGTQLVSAMQRAAIVGAVGLAVAVAAVLYFGDMLSNFRYAPIMLIVFLAVFTVVAIKITGTSFNNYFKGVFNKYLDDGRVLIVIDVPHKQAHRVESLLATHSKAAFIADCSTLGSPIPG